MIDMELITKKKQTENTHKTIEKSAWHNSKDLYASFLIV